MDIHKNARLTPHSRAELAIASAGREVMRLAVGVFNTRDATLAKQLMSEKAGCDSSSRLRSNAISNA